MKKLEIELWIIYKVITVIGIIAGFGFTALPSAKTFHLFLFGQFILFLTIAIGIFWIKKTFLDEASDYKSWMHSLGQIIDRRMKISSRDTIEDVQKEMHALEAKELELIQEMKKGGNDNKGDYRITTLNVLCYLFIGGSIMLLTSFLDVSKIVEKLILKFL